MKNLQSIISQLKMESLQIYVTSPDFKISLLLILHYKTAKEYKEKIKLLIDLKKSKFGKN